MLRFLLALALTSCVASAQSPARVINGAGSFVRVTEGWKCTATQKKFVPPLLRQLSVGDIVEGIDDLNLSTGGPLVLAEGVRRAQFRIVSSATVLRNGEQLEFAARAEAPASDVAEIMVSQDSPEVLRSSVPGLPRGARIESIGGKSWEAFAHQFRAGAPTPVINIDFKAPAKLSVSVDGHGVEIRVERSVRLTGVKLPKLIGSDEKLLSFLDGLTLRGLNTGDFSLKNSRGKWLLVHFWASWCRACLAEAPSVAELAKHKDLAFVAVGYVDDPEKLRRFAASVPGFTAYAPDETLTSELAVDGVPFDVLISPGGRPMAAVSGILPEGLLRTLVMSYLEP